MNFEISRRARLEIARIHAWWTANRPAARSLFLDELEAAERILRATPELGTLYSAHRSGPVRRLLLVDTGYHLYYRYIAQREEIIVVAIWGAARRRGPRI